MNKAKRFTLLKSERGVTLILTFFMMIIILVAILSISVLLYSEIKVIKNMSNSMISIFAADSGIEKVLYYDRQVKPEGAKRGLCPMLDTCTSGNDSIDCTSVNDNKDCNGESLNKIDCDPATCSNCSIAFNTTFNYKKYCVTAKVYPLSCKFNDDCTSSHNCDNNFCAGDSIFEIDSRGTFGGSQRQIQTITGAKNP